MSFNETDGEPLSEEECDEREALPILSLVYSLLAVVIIGHLLFRWHWRRRKLSRFRFSQPGDKSFKSKTMRNILRRDFSTIKALKCDPRLVQSDFPPHLFRRCAEGEAMPVHWYRMVAFDAAADFMSTHGPKQTAAPPPESHASRPHTQQATPLSEYLGTVVVTSSAHSNIVQSLTELYKLARYNDGEFGQEELQLFQEQLQQLREILSGNEGVGTEGESEVHPPRFSPSNRGNQAGITWQRQSTTTYSSQDPLLRMSSTEVITPDDRTRDTHTHSKPKLTPITVSTAESSSHQQFFSSSRQQRGQSKMKPGGASESELLPLVTAQLSPTNLPRSSISTVFEEEARFTVGVTESDKQEESSSQPWQRLESVETQV